MTKTNINHNVNPIPGMIAQLIDSPVVISNEKGDVQFANPAFCEVLQTRAELVIGRQTSEVLGKTKPDIDIGNIQQVLARTKKWQKEIQLSRQWGKISWFRLSVFRDTTSQEDATFFIWVFTDISDQKELEQRLFDRENRLNLILDNIPAYVYAKDRQGRYTYANKMMAMLYALKEEDIAGKTDFELMAPRGAEIFTKNDTYVFQTGKIFRSFEHAGEDEYGIERSYLSVKCPVKDSDGSVSEILGMSLDISEQQRLEKTLRENQEKLNTILNNMKARVFIKDRNFNYTYGNEEMCRNLGIDGSTLIGKNDYDLYEAETAVFFRSTDVEVFKLRTKVERLQAIKDPKTRELRHYMTIKVPLLNADGDPYSILGISTDVTEQIELEKALRRNETQLSTILENIKAHVYVKDINAIYTYANTDLCDYLGLTKDDVIGKKDEELFGKDVAERFRKNDMKVFNYAETVTNTEKSTCIVTGKEHYFLSVKVPLMNEIGNPYALLGISTDFTEQKRLEQSLRAMASTDALTGTFNRRHFMELCKKEMSRADRYDNALSILMMDIDYFKVINDTFGHSVGDEAIKATTQICQRNLRETDSLARLGGEEFAILLPHTFAEGAVMIADRIRQDIERYVLDAGEGQTHQFTASFGVTTKTDEDSHVDDLLKRADVALYEAKSGGRNRVCQK